MRRLAGGQVVELPSQKDRALLAVLALQPGAIHARDKFAGLLWRERGEPQARDSLKHSLTRLRQCFGSSIPPPIVADRQSVSVDPSAVIVDVATFEQLLRNGAPEAIEQASVLCRGDFLEGLNVRDPAFEDWLLVERQRLRNLVDGALTRLLAQSMAPSDISSHDGSDAAHKDHSGRPEARIASISGPASTGTQPMAEH
jgi:DNA-binding SARP family transcriptional activator